MFGISSTEFLIILIVGLIVVGPQKLPELARALGRAIGEFRRATTDIKDAFEADESISEAKKSFNEAVSEGMRAAFDDKLEEAGLSSDVIHKMKYGDPDDQAEAEAIATADGDETELDAVVGPDEEHDPAEAELPFDGKEPEIDAATGPDEDSDRAGESADQPTGETADQPEIEPEITEAAEEKPEPEDDASATEEPPAEADETKPPADRDN